MDKEKENNSPPEEAPRYCPNCHYPLSGLGNYCCNCGQKYTTGRITLGQLMRDLFEAIFNFDSKIFRTLGAIFIPGKLTNRFIEGYHQRYVSPIRLFLALAVLFLAALGFLIGDDLNRAFEANTASLEQEAYQALFLEKLDSARTNIESAFDTTGVLPEALDSLTGFFEDTRGQQSTLYYFDNAGGVWPALTLQEVQVPQKDLIVADPDSLIADTGVEGWMNKLILRQQIRLQLRTGSFAQFMLGKTLWMAFFMMPALALILKLLYIRRDRYYLEHLVFSFHYHAFLFLIFTIGIVLITIDESTNLFSLITLIAYIYLLFEMKRVYRQGWGKTIVKFLILSSFYMVLFILFFSLTLGVSAFLF